MNNVINKDKEIGWILFLSLLIGLCLFLFPISANVKLFGGLILLVLILWKVELGLYIAIMMMPFISFKYIAVLIFYTFACYIGKKIYKKEAIKITAADGFLSIFFILLIFSTIFSITLRESMKELFLYTSVLLMVFMITRDLDRKEINRLLMFFVIAAIFVSLYGIYQYATGAVGGHGWVDVKTNPNLKTRAYSTMENPNVLAEYLVTVASMAIVLLLDSKNLYRKLFLSFSTLILLVCLALTFSRGGWVAFAISIFIILISENKKVIPLLVLLGAVSLIFLPEVVIDRLQTIGSIKDSSNVYRFLIWSASLDMLKDFWPSGVGLGYAAYIKAYPNYTLAGIKAAHAHNTYLQIAIETGILGLLIFLLNVIKVYGMGVWVAIKSKDSFFRRICIASIGAISGLLFHALVEHVLFDYKVVFSFWFMIAIIIAAYKEASHHDIDDRTYEM